MNEKDLLISLWYVDQDHFPRFTPRKPFDSRLGFFLDVDRHMPGVNVVQKISFGAFPDTSLLFESYLYIPKHSIILDRKRPGIPDELHSSAI